MFNRIIKFSLQQRLVVLSLALLVFAAGLFIVPKIPVDVFPDLTRPTVIIATEAPGLAAGEVEKLVTFPIESAMNGLPGARRVRSVSKIGVSLVYVEFDWRTNIYADRQPVTEKLQMVQSQLPPGITPVLTPVGSIFGEIMILAVHSRTGKTSPLKLRTLSEWIIKRRLAAVPGVSYIQILGGDKMQYQVLGDPDLLRYYDVSLSEVAAAAADTNKNTGGGFFQTPDEQLVVRNLGRTDHVRDIAGGVVAYRHGVPVYIKNVARVTRGPQIFKIGDGLYSERSGGRVEKPVPAVLLNIIRQPNANTVDLSRRLQVVLAGLQSALPSDVVITPMYDQSRFIQTSVKNVEDALRDGGVLVTAVLFLFLFSFRPTLIALGSIPLSLTVSVLIMRFYGMTLNTMSFGGLAVALGALVDDAIVDVENVYRRLRENRRLQAPRPLFRVVYEASREIRGSIVYATFVIALVFVPLFFLPGVSGRMFAPLGAAYLLSLLASLGVSLTVTPALCYSFLARGDERQSAAARETEGEEYSKFTAWLKNLYGKSLSFCLRSPGKVLGTAVLLFVVSLALFPFMGTEFLPRINERSVMVALIAPPVTSVRESDRIAALEMKRLLTVPEIREVSAKIGRAKLTEDADPVYRIELDARLGSSGRTRDEILGDVRRKMQGVPGVDAEISQRLYEDLSDMLTGVAGQVVVKLFGDDLNVLREKGNEILALMARVKGVVDLAAEKQVLVPEVRIVPDRETAARYGLNPGAMNDLLELSLQGKTVSKILETGRAFDLFVGYDAPYRGSLSAIGGALVRLPGGESVPVSSAARVEIAESPNEILHDYGKRRLAVHCNIQGRDAGSAAREIERRIRKNVPLPPGYYVSYEGQFQEQRSAARTIYFLSAAVLFGMFIILYSEFRSARLVFLILAGLPLAVIGGAAAVFLSGKVLSIASLFGFIAVFGIAARNGIMLVSHFLYLMGREGESFTDAMILRGAKERLVPILMTALTAALGMVPLALAKGQPGKEILQPLSVVILGGLASSTLLNLFAAPVLFRLFGRPAEKLSERAE